MFGFYLYQYIYKCPHIKYNKMPIHKLIYSLHIKSSIYDNPSYDTTYHVLCTHGVIEIMIMYDNHRC